MNIITKLALNRITTKKARSGVICAAIFLTIVLFMTVVSLSSNLLTGYGLMMRLAVGLRRKSDESIRRSVFIVHFGFAQ